MGVLLVMVSALSAASTPVPLAGRAGAEEQFEPYQPIEVREIFSGLITRNCGDRVYSGQVRSREGLAQFEKSYGIERAVLEIDFERQMLIFGITDDISTRAYQFLRQKSMKTFVLDYFDTGIRYRLPIAEKGTKCSYLQVFILERIDGVTHIGVKNLVRDGLSKVYGRATL